MESGFAIGPGQPCFACGRDYGEHEKGCSNAPRPKAPPAPGPAFEPSDVEYLTGLAHKMERGVHLINPQWVRDLAARVAGTLALATRPHLFQAGDFVLRSGKKSGYKVECDALAPRDWEGIAAAVMEERVVPEPFGITDGVPRGGVPFAEAMRKYATPGCPTVLLCEDVVTTGGSTMRWLKTLQDDPQCLWMTPQTPFMAVCFLARGPHPGWIHPLLRGPGV